MKILIKLAVIMLLNNQLFIHQVSATSFLRKDMTEVFGFANIVIRGKLVQAHMEDEKGKILKDPEARTGPGLNNQIFYTIVVKEDLLGGSGLKLGTKIKVGLNKFMHLSNKNLMPWWDKKEEHIFLITSDKGKYRPAYPMNWHIKSADYPDSPLNKLINESK